MALTCKCCDCCEQPDNLQEIEGHQVDHGEYGIYQGYICKVCGETWRWYADEMERHVLDYKLRHGAPYSKGDYLKAQQEGYDLDNWNDYEKFYGLGTSEPDDWWRS